MAASAFEPAGVVPPLQTVLGMRRVIPREREAPRLRHQPVAVALERRLGTRARGERQRDEQRACGGAARGRHQSIRMASAATRVAASRAGAMPASAALATMSASAPTNTRASRWVRMVQPKYWRLITWIRIMA